MGGRGWIRLICIPYGQYRAKMVSSLLRLSVQAKKDGGEREEGIFLECRGLYKPTKSTAVCGF